MVIVQPFILAALLLCLVTAFITDIRIHKIPNWLTYPIIVLAIFAYSIINGYQGLIFSTAGLGLGFAVLAPFYAIGGMGAGDVKLMAAVGAALGPVNLFYAFLCTAIAGGIYSSIVLLSGTGRIRRFLSRFYAALRTFVLVRELSLPRIDGGGSGLKMYYGLAISIGTLVYIFFEIYRGNITFLFL